MTRTTHRSTAVLLALLLAGCDHLSAPSPDQCLRAELFDKCLRTVPPGPARTNYNDWAEVVAECGSSSYYQSLRQASQISQECRGS